MSDDLNKSTSSLFKQLGVISHGIITFPRNHSSKAKFVRIPVDASPVLVKDLFFQQHKQKRPSLVLTVIGSAKAYSMKSKLFEIFRKGLVNVAKTADVWIMTSAGTTCISKLMGKIVRTNPDPSHPMYLIGISQWGYIAGVEQLDVQGTNVIYSQSTNDGINKKLLEPNHTHFILIDDEPEAEYIENIPFLSQLEKTILEESISLHIPIVLLVIKGGYEDIEKVHESVVKNKIPVIFIEGSGGCCDLLAKCYHLYNKYHPKINSCDDTILILPKEEIYDKLLSIYHNYKEDLYYKLDNKKDEIYYFELIYECLEKHFLYLNFIDLTIRCHIKPSLDSVILQSFFNVTTGNDLEEMNTQQKHEQLNLAFEWKRLDIVKNFIIKDDRDWKSFGLNDIFEKALLQNQIEFIQLFLDYDFPLDELFNTNQKIFNLYEQENYQFKHGFDHPLQAIYVEIIQPLTRFSFQIDAIFNLQEIDVEKELFLWSILTGKQELALLFWSRGTNKVCTALIATLLYKSKARKEKNQNYIKYADEFQNLAVQILENFYLTNPM